MYFEISAWQLHSWHTPPRYTLRDADFVHGTAQQRAECHILWGHKALCSWNRCGASSSHRSNTASWSPGLQAHCQFYYCVSVVGPVAAHSAAAAPRDTSGKSSNSCNSCSGSNIPALEPRLLGRVACGTRPLQ